MALATCRAPAALRPPFGCLQGPRGGSSTRPTWLCDWAGSRRWRCWAGSGRRGDEAPGSGDGSEVGCRFPFGGLGMCPNRLSPVPPAWCPPLPAPPFCVALVQTAIDGREGVPHPLPWHLLSFHQGGGPAEASGPCPSPSQHTQCLLRPQQGGFPSLGGAGPTWGWREPACLCVTLGAGCG